MKRTLLTALIVSITGICFSQTYIALYPAVTNTAGTFPDKTNIALEIGRQWDVFSMGIDLGKTSLEKQTIKDTTVYLELRPNLNIFQQGRFTNTLTIGIGYIFSAGQSLMTEITSGIEYTFNDRLHFNLYFGQYYYSGRYDASTVTFFGISGMLYFTPSKAKSLFKPSPKQ